MSAIETVTLPRVGTLKMGETIIEKDCTGEGLPIYSADKSNRPWAFSTHFKRLNKRGVIVLGARGTIGYPRLPRDEEFGATQTTITLTPDPEHFQSEFVYFALQQLDFTLLGAQQAIPMLTVGNLESVTIPKFPKPEQTKIAEILSTVDRAIEQTEALIARQQRLKTGLMQDLLTRGIDEHGNLRSEQTHQFKDSPLGRIPVEWEVETLASIGTWASGGTPFKANPNFWGDEVPWVCPKDMKTFDLHATIENLTHLGLRNGSKLMPAECVFIVVRGMILAHTFPVCITSCPMALNQDVKGIVVAQNIEARFLAYWLFDRGQSLLKITTTATHGTKRFDMNELFAVPIAVPAKVEQTQIVAILDKAETQIATCKRQKEKLCALRTALMQDLLTGRKRVNALLNKTEATA